MPDFEAYLSQARYNNVLANQLLDQNKPDWAITVAFYSALHAVHAALRDKGIEPNNLSHKDIENRIRSYFDSDIRILYTSMKNSSELVRYIKDEPEPGIIPPSHSHEFIKDAEEIVKRDLPSLFGKVNRKCRREISL